METEIQVGLEVERKNLMFFGRYFSSEGLMTLPKQTSMTEQVNRRSKRRRRAVSVELAPLSRKQGWRDRLWNKAESGSFDIGFHFESSRDMLSMRELESRGNFLESSMKTETSEKSRLRSDVLQCLKQGKSLSSLTRTLQQLLPPTSVSPSPSVSSMSLESAQVHPYSCVSERQMEEKEMEVEVERERQEPEVKSKNVFGEVYGANVVNSRKMNKSARKLTKKVVAYEEVQRTMEEKERERTRGGRREWGKRGRPGRGVTGGIYSKTTMSGTMSRNIGVNRGINMVNLISSRFYLK